MIGQQLSQLVLARQVPAEFSYVSFGSLGSESANRNEGLSYVNPVGLRVYIGDVMCCSHYLLPRVLMLVGMAPKKRRPEGRRGFRDTRSLSERCSNSKPDGDRVRRNSRERRRWERGAP